MLKIQTFYSAGELPPNWILLGALGTDRLALVVSPGSPLKSLSLDTARQVFSGSINTWGGLHDACPDCFETTYDEAKYKDIAISLSFYPAEEDIQVLFDLSVMAGQPVASASAALIPDPQSMIETITKSESAIGFVPARALDSSVKEIALTGMDALNLTQPILAIAKNEPQGVTREWLLCLQKVLNP
jgi:ABC-type phosphate transport system substrate-binding protein